VSDTDRRRKNKLGERREGGWLRIARCIAAKVITVSGSEFGERRCSGVDRTTAMLTAGNT
jgi:hypothetical protein